MPMPMFPSSYSLSSKPPPPKYSDFSGYGKVIVICSFILYLIVDGIAYNLGLINSAWLAEFKQSETATSWIGSIFYSVPLLSAPITARLVEKFGCKTITIVCSIISTFGFVMSSFCGSIEQLYLTVGVIAGFGVSAGYVVGILSAERWFEKNRTLAIGIVSAGTGFGTFLIAPITQRLLDAYGWRNVMYFLASLNVLMGFVGCFISEPQWVIDEMEKNGDRELKRSENYGIFEEHETSFGTFRRLSIEAIDAVRCRLSQNYGHLEEVVEEKERNLDYFEGSTKKEAKTSTSKFRSEPCLATTNNSRSCLECETMQKTLNENQTESQTPQNLQNSKNTSHHPPTTPQTNIKALFNLNKEYIDQQINANNSQDHNNLENNINTTKTSSTANLINSNSHSSNNEIENERMTVQLPQNEVESYQEENWGSDGDCEALTSIIGAKKIRIEDEDCVDCQCLSKDDVRAKFGEDNEQDKLNEQVFTISGQDLKNHPQNLKICQHYGNNNQNGGYNLKNRHSIAAGDIINLNHNFKNPYSNNDEQNLEISQHNLKISQHPPNITKSNNNLQYSKFENNQPPPYSQSCYVFQNSDTNHTSPSNKPQISTIIFKFIKEKFKMFQKLFSHFANRDFTLLAISTFAIYSLYNIPIYFIVELLKNYDYTEAECANFISLIGISILIGMVTLGYVGDVSGNQVKNVNAMCVLVCGIAEIILPNCADNAVAFSICCFIFGFSFSSAYVLIPKIAEMIVGVEEFASAIGLNFFVQGLALLVGIPFASTIYEAIGCWKIAFEICGTIISFGSIFAYLVKVNRGQT